MARRVLRRPSRRLVATASERRTLAGLGSLLVVGLILRFLLILAWRPGFLGYPDSAVYLDAARGHFSAGSDPRLPNTVFFDKMRPAGYPIFLEIVHRISSRLTFVIVVQHGLGIATAVLLYLTVRRAGVPEWLGLVPAACILLGGTEIFIEHAALTEALYIFLQAGALYAAVRSLDSRDPGWGALSGFLIGAAADVRWVGLLLIPILAVWLVLARRDSRSGKLLHAFAAVSASAVMVGAYVYAQKQTTGYTGLARSGAWNLYGRVAPFADCSKFMPPPGTRVLCETRPVSQRPGPDRYIFISSPARTAFGGPDWGEARLATAQETAKVGAFARAVIIHQPFDYARTVAREMVRYVFPDLIKTKPGDGLTSGQLISQLEEPVFTKFTIDGHARPWYRTGELAERRGLLHALERYERVTRFDGVLMIALLLPTLCGPFVARGRLRAMASLFTIVSLVLMVTSPATIFWDARLAIPVYGILGASAAFGGWALWLRGPGSTATHLDPT